MPHAFGNGLVLTLGIYLDKAGPSPDIQAVTVAGVIAKADDWIAFSKEWERALADFEHLPFFHMSAYDSGFGPYKAWQARSVKQERLGRLLGIIEKHVMAIFGASVAIADCAHIHPNAPIEPAYTFTAGHCFNMLPQYRYLIENPDEQVLYTFEASDQGHGKLQTV